MIRRPPRSTQSRSSAASDVYKRQARDLVQQFHVRRAVAPGQVEAARPFQVQDAALEALHGERAAGPERDRVQPVGVAVEVRLEDPVGLEDPTIRSEARGRLVLGPVHRDDVALVGAGHHLVTIGALGAGHVAAVPTAWLLYTSDAADDLLC